MEGLVLLSIYIYEITSSHLSVCVQNVSGDLIGQDDILQIVRKHLIEKSSAFLGPIKRTSMLADV